MSAFLHALARASIEGGVFIAVVWLLLRIFPRVPVATRATIWWFACVGLLVRLVISPIELPLWPAVPPQETVPVAVQDGELEPGTPAPAVAPATPFPWIPLLGAAWLVGIALFVAAAVRQVLAMRRMLRRAEPVLDPVVTDLLARLCHELDVPVPSLVSSAAATSPQLVGLGRRPVIVLPADAVDRLTPEQLEMALAHELTHVRRRDLWFAWVPTVTQSIFFFHPFAWLASREWSIACEASCDAEVVDRPDTSADDYGRLLIQVGVKRRAGVGALAVGAPYHALKRRLEMLEQVVERPGARSLALAGVVIGLALVPLTVVAQRMPPRPPVPVPAPVIRSCEDHQHARPVAVIPEVGEDFDIDVDVDLDFDLQIDLDEKTVRDIERAVELLPDSVGKEVERALEEVENELGGELRVELPLSDRVRRHAEVQARLAEKSMELARKRAELERRAQQNDEVHARQLEQAAHELARAQAELARAQGQIAREHFRADRERDRIRYRHRGDAESREALEEMLNDRMNDKVKIKFKYKDKLKEKHKEKHKEKLKEKFKDDDDHDLDVDVDVDVDVSEE